jgi:hypothetical protein
MNKQDILAIKGALSFDPYPGATVKSCSITKGYAQSPVLSLSYVVRGNTDYAAQNIIQRIIVQEIEFDILSYNIRPSRTGIEVSINGIDSTKKYLDAYCEHFVSYISRPYGVLVDGNSMIFLKIIGI